MARDHGAVYRERARRPGQCPGPGRPAGGGRVTATLVEPGLVSRHTAPDLAPILFHVLSAQPSTPLDLAGVRDPSVRAALASMDDEVSGALYGRPQSAITVLTASEVITSALGTAIGVVVRVASAAADALAKPAEAQATRHPERRTAHLLLLEGRGRPSPVPSVSN